MKWIGRGWRGEMTLGKIYWVYGLLYPFLFGLMYAVVVLVFYSSEEGYRPALNSGMEPYEITFYAVMFIYTLWWSVGTWRSAKNAKMFWCVLARIIVVISVVGSLVGIFDFLILMVLPEPVQTTDNFREQCMEQMTKYATDNGVSPEKYISENQSYLQQCTQYLTNKDSK